ncbi:hypothetical protein CLU79DRAFT_729539 [Phycomyces nitens]|nr:hypothetical protein CLU79DRAFT_729539 [Phycomyces nitens]
MLKRIADTHTCIYICIYICIYHHHNNTTSFFNEIFSSLSLPLSKKTSSWSPSRPGRSESPYNSTSSSDMPSSLEPAKKVSLKHRLKNAWKLRRQEGPSVQIPSSQSRLDSLCMSPRGAHTSRVAYAASCTPPPPLPPLALDDWVPIPNALSMPSYTSSTSGSSFSSSAAGDFSSTNTFSTLSFTMSPEEPLPTPFVSASTPMSPSSRFMLVLSKLTSGTKRDNNSQSGKLSDKIKHKLQLDKSKQDQERQPRQTPAPIPRSMSLSSLSLNTPVPKSTPKNTPRSMPREIKPSPRSSTPKMSFSVPGPHRSSSKGILRGKFGMQNYCCSVLLLKNRETCLLFSYNRYPNRTSLYYTQTHVHSQPISISARKTVQRSSCPSPKTRRRVWNTVCKCGYSTGNILCTRVRS